MMVNSKKTVVMCFRLAKKKSRFFVHFLAVVLHDHDMKLPTFMLPLFGVGEHNTKILFFFF